jgi:hypothetical protein
VEVKPEAATPSDPAVRGPRVENAADAILRKMARSALADLQTERAAESSERGHPADEMARHLLHLPADASVKPRPSPDTPSAAPPQ